jgi:hypothetical protein
MGHENGQAIGSSARGLQQGSRITDNPLRTEPTWKFIQERSPMRDRWSRYSIFFHSQDRGTFVAYFLGAVVPLIALGIVAERFVLSPIAGPIDSYVATLGDGGILLLFAAISLLSLSCFFMLRRLVRNSIETWPSRRRSLRWRTTFC